MPSVLTMIRRSLPVLLLAVAVGACEDELNAPEVQSCDERLDIQVQAPATLEYRVRAGSAIVERITYTALEGDTTITSFPDQDPNDFRFDRSVQFLEPTDAQLRVLGEVATGGQIAITYTIVPADDTQDVVPGPIAVCPG